MNASYLKLVVYLLPSAAMDWSDAIRTVATMSKNHMVTELQSDYL